MADLSQRAYHAYRGLVYETPGFTDYFFASTPIAEIAELNLGGIIVMGDAVPMAADGVHDVEALQSQLAETQENFSCGFWPGNAAVSGVTLGEPAFYAYAYPAPPEFATVAVRPAAALYDPGMGEFVPWR